MFCEKEKKNYPSREFFAIQEKIITWNRVLKLYQGEEEVCNLEEARKNAEKIAMEVRSSSPPGNQILFCNDGIGEWVYSPSGKSRMKILYIHGGGFIAGSVDNHRPFAGILAKHLEADVFMAGYPLAPENPFPKALETCMEMYEYLGNSVEKDFFTGIIADSAGANIGLSLLMMMDDKKLKKRPDFAVFMSGFFDLSLNSESIKKNIEKDIVLSPELLEFSVNLYAEAKDLSNPLISPVYGDFSGLPNLFFQVGSHEILLDDSLRCHNKALKSGVKSYLTVWPKMFHSFQGYYNCMPESVKAIDEIKSFTDMVISEAC